MCGLIMLNVRNAFNNVSWPVIFEELQRSEVRWTLGSEDTRDTL